MRNTHLVHTLKYITYGVMLILLYVLQSVPHLFEIRGVKPIWVIPAAIIVAMFEGEFVGGIFGALAGLFCDMGGFSLFGFRAVLTLLCCVSAGMLVIYLLHCNLTNALGFAAVALILEGSLDYLFTYSIWGYESSWMVLTGKILPTAVYSLAVVPLLFWLIRAIFRRFEAALRD
ncbi:hypothetical protein U6B65_06490 [Oscillospiraceae bacterium MB08-C2-2]|nr:hypothetical protein U6B65_06490 [Oscillospiraceae bacterium MB08-C2-2]